MDSPSFERLRFMGKDIHLAVGRQESDYVKALLDEDKDLVSKTNKLSETALHIACRNPLGNRCTRQLIEAHADVNARNKWGQTPLHYAARARSMQSIEVLVQSPDINVNARDCNGYNALHVLISTLENKTFDENSVTVQMTADMNNAVNVLISTLEGETFDQGEEVPDAPKVYLTEEFKLITRKLVAAGIDINSQSKWGQTILHLAAKYNDPLEYLTYLMTEYHSLDVFLVNKMGETFLYFVEWFDETVEILSFLEIIERIHPESVSRLLNTRNSLGIPPWFFIVEKCFTDEGSIETMLEKYTIDANATDNMGENILHHLAMAFGTFAYELQLLIIEGTNTECRNIFGQTPVSGLFVEDVLNVFLENNVDLNAKDRWNRTPFMHIANQNPNPVVLAVLIANGNFDVNAQDNKGSTALHFAAYNGFEAQIKLLLSIDADKNIADMLKQTPLQTAKYHQNFKACELLDETTIIYRREMHTEVGFENVLLCKSSQIKMSEMFSDKPIHSLVGLPESMDTFSEYLLKTKHVALTQFEQGEEMEILNALRNFVQALCGIVGGYDRRFTMTMFPTGSTVEGTKTGRPDEFDFVLCLEALNEVFEPEKPDDVVDRPHASLRFNESIESDDFLPFTNEDGYFMPLPFLHYLFGYCKMAMHDTRLWENGNLYHRYEDKFHVIDGKPVFNVDIYWLGLRYKQLKISVDLVPAVFKRGWVHLDAILSSPIVKDASGKPIGTLLLLQTETNDFDKEWSRAMNESIFDTCNTPNYSKEARNKRRNLRISVAPAEIHYIKQLPEIFRQAYAFAKIMKSEICPELIIDSVPKLIGTLYTLYKLLPKKSKYVKASKIVKSYMLKNCLFYVAEEMKNNPGSLTPIQITVKIYERLQQSLEEWEFKPYFLRLADIYQYEHQGRIELGPEKMTYPRYFCVQLILALLGRDFNRKQMKLLPRYKKEI